MARVKLRRDSFEREALKRGLIYQAQQAAAIGVHESIHSRALNGHRELSGPYIIGVLMLAGNVHVRRALEDLFDVETMAKAS